MPTAAASLNAPFIARAGSGVIYAFLQNEPNSALGPGAEGPGVTAGFEMMAKVKDMFDPERLLNRGRLYGRL